MLTTSTTGLCGRAMVLSSLLARPIETEQLWQVRDDYFASQWDRTTAEATRGLALLRESAAAREDIGKLAADFERLFVGAPPRIIPRESAYRPEVTPEDISEIYKNAGVTIPGELPSDHIASELAFVAQLPMVSPTPTRLLAQFAHDHLRSWAPVCLAEISMRAGTLFYQGVGALAMDYIESIPSH